LRLRAPGVRRPAAEAAESASEAPGMGVVVPVLGVAQILAWGSSYYLFACLQSRSRVALIGRWPGSLVACRSGCSRPASSRRGLATASSDTAPSPAGHERRPARLRPSGSGTRALLPDPLRRRGGQCWLPLDEDGQTIAIERVASMEPSTARPQRGSARPTALQGPLSECRGEPPQQSLDSLVNIHRKLCGM
jgi:hypothetical protein